MGGQITMPTIRGPIFASFRMPSRTMAAASSAVCLATFTLEVALPGNTRGDLYVPLLTRLPDGVTSTELVVDGARQMAEVVDAGSYATVRVGAGPHQVETLCTALGN